MTKYKHLAIYKDTDKRFNKNRDSYGGNRERPVTDDEFINKLLELWEDVEAGVLEVKPK